MSGVKSYLTADEGDDLRAAAVAAVAPQSNPIFSITTAHGTFPQDTTNYVNCLYSLTGAPGQDAVYATGKVRGRGNNTWGQPKKPFRVKLDDSTPLLGMPTNKDWALLANYNDPAALSTGLAFKLGTLAPGLPWTPRYGFVDLYFNGEYLGNYQLAETVEAGVSRVNVAKASGTTGLALTGTYLLELGIDTDQDKAYYQTTQGVGVNADDPDGSNATQWAYITDWIQDFEDVLYGSGFADPTTGFRAYVDVPSFIDWYLIEEFASNVEGGFASSCKVYKTRDSLAQDGVTVVPGKLVMGPLWDFDRSFGSPESGPPTGYRVRPGAKWLDRMFADPAFSSEAAARWATLKAAITAAGGMNKIIDRATARIAAAQLRDAARWGYEYDWTDLAGVAKVFANARMTWMDGALV